MGSLESRKRKRLFILALMVICLGSLLAWNILRPSDEDQLVAEYEERLLSGDMRNATPEERERFRKEWMKLPEKTRERVISNVMKKRLEKVREELSEMSKEEREEKIKVDVEKMKKRFNEMSEDEKKRIKERMKEEDSKKFVKRVRNFFYSELSAREREELDPLMDEWFRQLEAL